MATPALGQYSLVSYVHQLRGERVNVGVLVWHPRGGTRVQFCRSLVRVRSIDENADLTRVRREMDAIEETLGSWTHRAESPLEDLNKAFRFGLTVGTPMNARMQDPTFTLERLYTSLIAPEPFMRASSSTQFSKAFVETLRHALQAVGPSQARWDYLEDETFQPVKITAFYRLNNQECVWRTFSFASINSLDEQLTVAKAIHAENNDLRSLPKYRKSELSLAVQMPKPTARADWEKSLEWLHREAGRVEVFVDRQSLEEKVPELVTVG